MTKHCIASIRKEIKEKQYREYLTELLRSVIKLSYGIEVPSYASILEESESRNNKDNQESEKTSDEIISNLKQKLAKLGE